MNKSEHILAISKAVMQPMVTLVVECSACNEEISESYAYDDISDIEKEYKSIAEKAYTAGWRFGNNRVFSKEGVFCPTCVKNKSNEQFYKE